MRDRLYCVLLVTNPDLTRIVWKRRKNTNKGYNRISSNILTGLGITVSRLAQLLLVFYRYVRGILAKISAQRAGLIKGVVNVLDWDINDVFNDSTTQEVNWHHSHDAG